MAAIGVDTHKTTLAACAVDPLGSPIAESDLRQRSKGPSRVHRLGSLVT
jgi:hypothetical protein